MRAPTPPSDKWRALGDAIELRADGVPVAPSAALAAFSGRKHLGAGFTEDETKRVLPKTLHDELTRAFLYAEARHAGLEPRALNQIGAALGPLALTPLGVAAIRAEIRRLAGEGVRHAG